MHVIGRDAVIQERHLEVGQVIAQPGTLLVPVARESEQKVPVVAAMCHMEDSSLSAEPIGPSHGCSLPAAVGLTTEKAASKASLSPGIGPPFLATILETAVCSGDRRP